MPFSPMKYLMQEDSLPACQSFLWLTTSSNVRSHKYRRSVALTLLEVRLYCLLFAPLKRARTECVTFISQSYVEAYQEEGWPRGFPAILQQYPGEEIPFAKPWSLIFCANFIQRKTKLSYFLLPFPSHVAVVFKSNKFGFHQYDWSFVQIVRKIVRKTSNAYTNVCIQSFRH